MIPDSLKRYNTFLPANYVWFYRQASHCKVLALNGSRDIHVIAASNLAGIRASLQKSHSPKYDAIELPGLNHLFQTCIKCSMVEYMDLEETFSRGVGGHGGLAAEKCTVEDEPNAHF